MAFHDDRCYIDFMPACFAPDRQQKFGVTGAARRNDLLFVFERRLDQGRIDNILEAFADQ